MRYIQQTKPTTRTINKSPTNYSNPQTVITLFRCLDSVTATMTITIINGLILPLYPVLLLL